MPGHTWGHMVYLVDDEYLFTGDTIWSGADGLPVTFNCRKAERGRTWAAAAVR